MCRFMKRCYDVMVVTSSLNFRKTDEGPSSFLPFNIEQPFRVDK